MDILTFLEKGYTAFHVTQNVAQYLAEKGFCPLEMGQKWQLRQGKSLYERLTQEKVLDSDLYAVPAEKPFYAGAEKEYLCGARIDNLTSVYACMQAIADCVPQNVAVAAFLDNEEVGSSTRQGSPLFLQRVLNRIEQALGMTDEQREEARQKGMVLSVDNGHATHPAHPEKSDATFPVTLNGGAVIKHHPNYATDGLTSALLKNVLQGKVPVQDYYNRSDVRCGSTLGLVTSRTLQMKTCDVGAAQLAMHSACETMGAKDVGYVTQALTEFLNASLE